MDVHQESTTFCFFDPAAPQGRQYRTVTRPTTAEAIRATLLAHDGRCQVAFEVGTQAQWVVSIVRPMASEVQVANPSRIPWLFRDGRKNDAIDARKLATLLYLGQLPEVHLPSADVSAWRALINHRRRLVQRRTRTKNQIRSILRTFACRCPHKSCWSRVGQAWLRSLTFDTARDLMMRMLFDELTFLQEKLAQAEQQLDTIAASQRRVALLQTIPGIGPRTSEAIVAFSDGPERFSNRKRFASYFGMTPTEDSSGLVRRHGHISKRGPSVVRWVLNEAAHQVIRRCGMLRSFYTRVHRGRKDRKKKALVAVGRKVLTIVYAMMRDDLPFDETRIGRMAA